MRERRGQSLAEVVSRRICDLIIEDRLKPGDLLPTEIKLTSKFGVSRGALRESIVRLSALGIVNVRHGYGTFVAALPTGILQASVDDSSATEREAIELREMLLTEAARLIARRNMDASLIHDALQSLAKAAPRDRDRAISEFYESVGKASRNTIIAQLLRALNVILTANGHQQTADITSLLTPLTEFATALRTGQADTAVGAIRRHLSGYLAA